MSDQPLRGFLWSYGPPRKIHHEIPKNDSSIVIGHQSSTSVQIKRNMSKKKKVARKLKKSHKNDGKKKKTTYGYTINSSKKNTVAVSTWFGCCALAIIPADLDKAAWGDRVVIGGPGNPGAPMGPPWGPQPEVLGTVPLWLRITHLSA